MHKSPRFALGPRLNSLGFLALADLAFAVLIAVGSTVYPAKSMANANGCVGQLAMGATTTISDLQTGPCVNSGAVDALTITSAGTISGGTAGIGISGANVTLLNNAGSVSGTQYGITNSATITTLVNTGTISGTTAGIRNTGTITTLNNSQGKSGTALTYSGTLPTNYNVIINSPSSFGQLSTAVPTGTTAFNIYGNTGTTLISGVPASVVQAGVYADVLQGFSTLTGFVTGTSGTYGSLDYSLVLDNLNAGWWNLVFSTPAPTPAPVPAPVPPTTMVAGTTVGLSSIGVTTNPVFDGGALTLSAGDNSSQTFTVQSAGGTIITPTSGSALLSGVFSGPGGLTMTGTGTLVMTGANTYSGGTLVSSGTLQGNTTSLQGAIVNNSAVVFDQAGSGTYTGTMSGTGRLALQNTGTLILTGANTYSGGTLVSSGTLQGNTTSLQGAIVNNSAVVFDQAGSGTYAGAMSGTGNLTQQNAGTLVLSGANTYSGGTTVSGGTLVVAGASPTGTGDVLVASSATLMGTGTIAGNVIVNGVFKPGNSPGYLSVTSSVTVSSGGTYQQDIAGKAQAASATPAGSTGFYSFLNVGGQYTVNPGATLSPRLQNLFSPSESGYGSAPYVPVVGDKFRILTAANGITGKFTTLTQPAGLASGTQLLQFYNYNGSNSLDLAVAPSSFSTASSGNKNAWSLASALDKMVPANQTGLSTTAQDALLYPASGQSIANLGSYLQGMSGEIYGATLAVVPQTTQRLQAAVLSRLGDSMFAPGRGPVPVTPPTNSAISATNPGGQPTASMSSNPGVNPYAASSGSGSMRNGAAWGEVAYQYGNRSSDSNSGGWTSNLVQAVVGVDAYSQGGTRAGGGLALSNTNVSAAQGSGTVQQGTLFLYGKMPVDQFVVDGMASYGFNSTNNTRNDPTGITSGLQAKNVQGNDALVSAGVSLPIETEGATLAPYARVTWQSLNQNGFNEGSAASALTVNSYSGNGVRGVIGLTAGSRATDPIKEHYTYKANVGVGMDSNAMLSPTLNASIAGLSTQIYTPAPSAAFVQIGVYGTAKIADSAYAYAGITSELRSGQALVGANVGLMIRF